jgi:hypothetical protein
MVLSRPHGSNREKLRYAAPYHVHLNGTGSNGRPGSPTFSPAQLQGHEIFFIMTPCQGMASPRHLQPRHAATTTTTVRMHELRGKLEIRSTLGPFLSTFVYSDTVTRPLSLHTIKGEGGTLDRKTNGETTPNNGNVLSTHSNTRTHPHTETWEPSLSRPACIPLLQALRCKATRAAASTERMDVQPEPVYILCLPCTPSETPTRNIIHLSRL